MKGSSTNREQPISPIQSLKHWMPCFKVSLHNDNLGKNLKENSCEEISFAFLASGENV